VIEKEAFIKGTRVYEYVADDGTVFYSFHRYPSKVLPPKRLFLQSRLGDHLNNFLVKLRHRGEDLAREGEED
jgi:hypothetical protein